MLDINLIREKPGVVREALVKRQMDPTRSMQSWQLVERVFDWKDPLELRNEFNQAA